MKMFYFLIPHLVKSLILFILFGCINLLDTKTTLLLKTKLIMPLRTERAGEGNMSAFFKMKTMWLFNTHQESLKSFNGYLKFLRRLRFLWSPYCVNIIPCLSDWATLFVQKDLDLPQFLQHDLVAWDVCYCWWSSNSNWKKRQRQMLEITLKMISMYNWISFHPRQLSP